MINPRQEDLDLRIVMVDGIFAKVHQRGTGAAKEAAPLKKAGQPKPLAKAGAGCLPNCRQGRRLAENAFSDLKQFRGCLPLC